MLQQPCKATVVRDPGKAFARHTVMSCHLASGGIVCFHELESSPSAEMLRRYSEKQSPNAEWSVVNPPTSPLKQQLSERT